MSNSFVGDAVFGHRNHAGPRMDFSTHRRPSASWFAGDRRQPSHLAPCTRRGRSTTLAEVPVVSVLSVPRTDGVEDGAATTVFARFSSIIAAVDLSVLRSLRFRSFPLRRLGSWRRPKIGGCESALHVRLSLEERAVFAEMEPRTLCLSYSRSVTAAARWLRRSSELWRDEYQCSQHRLAGRCRTREHG